MRLVAGEALVKTLVSVLFSEPKIPQSVDQALRGAPAEIRFSALQRAENSSIRYIELNGVTGNGFSALQRAENSSIAARQELDAEFLEEFQCSSASRKFLNYCDCRRFIRINYVSVLFSEPKIPQLRTAHY